MQMPPYRKNSIKAKFDLLHYSQVSEDALFNTDHYCNFINKKNIIKNKHKNQTGENCRSLTQQYFTKFKQQKKFKNLYKKPYQQNIKMISFPIMKLQNMFQKVNINPNSNKKINTVDRVFSKIAIQFVDKSRKMSTIYVSTNKPKPKLKQFKNYSP